jgi:hypothetical protein
MGGTSWASVPDLERLAMYSIVSITLRGVYIFAEALYHYPWMTVSFLREDYDISLTSLI